MAEDDKGDAQKPSPGPAGAEARRPRFTVRAQYLKDLSFENPRAPEVFSATQQPKVDVSVGVNGRHVGGDLHEVELHITAKALRGESVDFLVELVYGGLFQFVDFPADQLRPLVMVECPRLLFPFARRVIADSTREGGFPPLFLEPIDFLQLYLRHQQQREPAAQPQPPAGPPPSV